MGGHIQVYTGTRVVFKTSSVESLPFEDQFFDHVVCFGTFPHFEDKGKALKEMGRVLKINGILIIAHALSSKGIKAHHKAAQPVNQDFLPEEIEMKRLMKTTGFQVVRLIDRPKCYLCEGEKVILN